MFVGAATFMGEGEPPPANIPAFVAFVVPEDFASR
jgi:hypothetical protein